MTPFLRRQLPLPPPTAPPRPDRYSTRDTCDGTGTCQAIYHGWPRPDGPIAVVTECPIGTYRPLPHLIRHSPAGFNCGYDGNGPRDLALSLLLDALGDKILCPICTALTIPLGSTQPPCSHPKTTSTPSTDFEPSANNHCHDQKPYMHFTAQVVTHLPKEEAWSISRRDIILTTYPELSHWCQQ
jgi:hypothetical protein